jgi:3-hydroxyacyl-CoA dehydrogenase/enoyl-CoA hydratase/3-hydroxybutyryl-CoA epimerase
MLNEYKRRARPPAAASTSTRRNGKKHLWPELAERPRRPTRRFRRKTRDRILFIQAIETVRCVEEGVALSTADANVGSIFGTASPPGAAARCSSSSTA